MHLMYKQPNISPQKCIVSQSQSLSFYNDNENMALSLLSASTSISFYSYVYYYIIISHIEKIIAFKFMKVSSKDIYLLEKIYLKHNLKLKNNSKIKSKQCANNLISTVTRFRRTDSQFYNKKSKTKQRQYQQVESSNEFLIIRKNFSVASHKTKKQKPFQFVKKRQIKLPKNMQQIIDVLNSNNNGIVFNKKKKINQHTNYTTQPSQSTVNDSLFTQKQYSKDRWQRRFKSIAIQGHFSQDNHDNVMNKEKHSYNYWVKNQFQYQNKVKKDSRKYKYISIKSENSNYQQNQNNKNCQQARFNRQQLYSTCTRHKY